jgi:GT2 family glycosyltransferase
VVREAFRRTSRKYTPRALPLVDVVIVAYRSRDMVRAALESVRRHTPSSTTEIWVVDNDSRDGTAEVIRARFPHVRFLQAGRNLGFARANNIAIRQGTAPFVLALNPDSELTPGALDRMLEVLDAHPDVGMVGPALVRPDGSFDHAARRAFPTVAGALGHFTGLGRAEGATGRLAQYRAPDVREGPVDAINGACMLMRRAALDEIGLFDEGYWMYMEDLDLCYRFKEAGWLTWFEPGAVVMHVKAGTSGEYRRAKLNYAFHYGMYRFYRRHYAANRATLVNAAVYVGVAVKLLVSLVTTGIRRRMAGA